jgi:3-dehydrosphinganine reductase
MAISMKSFQNRVVLITGGSSGIGLALARKLAAEGARLWLLGRRKEVLEEALGQLRQGPGGCKVIAADVSDWSQVKSAVARIEKEDGLPDLVINSAGISHPGYVQEIPVEMFRQIIEINYLGTVHVTKAVLPGMIARHSGYIVNISSAAGFLGVFGYTAYGASKYAVRGFSDALRAEVKPLGIGVSIVFPPDTDTPQLAYENTIKPAETKELSGNAGVLSADQVAETTLKGVKRGQYVILPGSENKFLYRLSGLLGNGVYPVMDWMVADAMKKKARS